MVTAACSGGSSPNSVSLIPGKPPGAPGTQSAATSSLSFRIPLASHNKRVPSSLGRKAGITKPMYVSAYGNGGFTVIFDGQTVMNNQSFAPTLDSNGNPVPGPGPSGSATMPNGGTFSYTSTIVNNGSNVPYVQVNANYTTIPGSHTVGVVQTDGPCVPDQYKRELCISNTNGFVLAEGQTTFMLDAGSNAPNTLFLKGVIESAYLCDAACDGQAGTPDSNGFYSLIAYAADESGNTIYQQTDPGNNNSVVPFDNGPYAIVETDGNNIVSLGGHLGPYGAPGNDDPNGPYGEAFTAKCNSVGTATVAMQLLRSGTSTGSVNGYTYSAANYPQAGSILSVVGADEYFGNVLTMDCTASGSLIIE